MTLSPIAICNGAARLGSWGTLELSGPSSALLRPSMAENTELPESVAADLVAAVLLLNDQDGKLLILPYAGELAVAYDLKTCELAYPATSLPRNADPGLRIATVRTVFHLGVVHLTEATLVLFREDGAVAWRKEGDFSGWAIEGATSDDLLLVLADWAGNEDRQTRSMATGDVTS